MSLSLLFFYVFNVSLPFKLCVAEMQEPVEMSPFREEPDDYFGK